MSRIYRPGKDADWRPYNTFSDLVQAEETKEQVDPYNEQGLPTGIPDRKWFFNVLNTIYPKEVRQMVECAYTKRRQHYKTDDEQNIEMTLEFDKWIKEVQTYKSESPPN
jgi:hypothetical protein